LFYNLTKEEAEQKEINLISKYNSRDKKFGYNISVGGGLGTLGLKMSKETRQKMSENRRGENNHFYGKNHSDESKIKMSKAKVGKYRGKNSPNYGRHASEEIRQKLTIFFSPFASQL
jgi:group I intron endonuclease